MKPRCKLVATCLFFSLAAVLPADESFRVVVQDVRPEFLNVSHNARIVVACGEQSQHMFHVIDVVEPAVLMTVDLPEPVLHAAVAPQGSWFVLAGEKTVYRVDRMSGQYEVLFADTSGAVALNDAGDQLAVLGTLAFDPESDRLTRFFDVAKLGVYDLTRKKWTATTDTPIVADPVVFFDGDDVVGVGRGGRVYARRSSSFRCDVRLNLATGKAKVTRGLEMYRGVKDDDEYTSPKEFPAVLEAREAAIKKLDEVREKLSPLGAPSGLFHSLSTDDRVSILVDRSYSGRVVAGILNIRHDGKIDITPQTIDGPHAVRILDDRFVETYDARYGGKVFDLRTKQPALELPPTAANSNTNRLHKFFPTGCLFYEDGTLSWYRTTKPDAIWQMKPEQPLSDLYSVFVSPDNRYLGINNRQRDIMIDIYSLATGKEVVSIPRPKDRPSGHSLSPWFNRDGSRLGTTIEKRFHLYEIPSGKRLRDEPLPQDKHYWHVASAGEQWVIGSDFDGIIFDERTGCGPVIPLQNINRATEIRCRDRRSFLVETRHGLGAIVDCETGKLQAKWYVGHRQGNILSPEFPPRAFTAFDGKLLIRRLAHAAEIELIDLTTLSPIATVHPLPVDEKLGWIISTSDGYWDASPGAEQYVAVFSGMRRLAPDVVKRRRDAARTQSRLADLCKK